MFATGGMLRNSSNACSTVRSRTSAIASALVGDLQRLAVVALAPADLARDVDVGKEMHLDLDLPVAGTGLAPAPLHVEREAAGLVAAGAGLGSLRHQVPDRVEDPGVSRGVRARRSPIGDWSMSMTLSISKIPSTRSCFPGFSEEL